VQESKIATLEEECQQQADEIKVLSQALDIKAEETGIESELMYEVSKVKRENVILQDDLSNKDMMISSLQEELGELRQSEKEIYDANNSNERDLFTKTEELELLKEQVAVLKAEAEDREEEHERLLAVIQERSSEVSILKNKNEEIAGEKQHLEVHTVGELEQTRDAYQKAMTELHIVRDRYVEVERMYKINEMKLSEEMNMVWNLRYFVLIIIREHILKQQLKNFRWRILN
jgi:chromosome segregation ATPase